jgi:hypothetical protein
LAEGIECPIPHLLLRKNTFANAKGNVFERRPQPLDLVGGLSTLSSKSFACLESIIRDDWFAQPLNDVGHGP